MEELRGVWEREELGGMWGGMSSGAWGRRSSGRRRPRGYYKVELGLTLSGGGGAAHRRRQGEDQQRWLVEDVRVSPDCGDRDRLLSVYNTEFGYGFGSGLRSPN
jgi:hypothetical protein